jgi:hypothetical protein
MTVTEVVQVDVAAAGRSRHMGTSLAMIDRHLGHLAPDDREHAIRLLDTFSETAQACDVHAVDAEDIDCCQDGRRERPLSREKSEAL